MCFDTRNYGVLTGMKTEKWGDDIVTMVCGCVGEGGGGGEKGG